MKKLFISLLTVALIISLSACGSEKNSQNTQQSSVSGGAQNSIIENGSVTSDDPDVDLTKLSSTMVYSEVYNMMYTPNDYIGKTVKMKGQFSYYEDPETKAQYFACIIADATACCSQGLEFILSGEHTYPNDYPEVDSEITVTGTFETYKENGSQYCRLKNATLID